MERNNFLKNLSLFLFKIMSELVLILIVLFLLGLAAENVLPGTISSKLNFTKFSLLILLGLSLVIFIANKYDFSFPENKSKKIAVLFSVIFLIFIFSLSLLGFAKLEIIIILFLMLLILYYFYKILISGNRTTG